MANTLSTLVSKFKAFIGLPDVSSTLSRITSLIPYSSKNIYSDFIQTISSSQHISSILKQDSLFTLQFELNRLRKYHLYKSIYDRLPWCKRAIKVIVANILSPDTVSKQSIDVGKVDEDIGLDVDNPKIDVVIKNIKILFKQIKLPKLARKIIAGALIYGDYYVLIRQVDTEQVQESCVEVDDHKITLKEVSYPLLENESLTNSTAELLKDIPTYAQEKDQKTETYHNITVKLIRPQRVIDLTIEGICFGYLLLPSYMTPGNIDMARQMDLSRKATIAQKILSHIQTLKDLSDKQKEALTNTITDAIKALNLEMFTEVQYIPPLFMHHFKNELADVDEYDEVYGESLFASTELDAKILIALKTALAVHRINTSVERRIVNIEIGLPRAAEEKINELKLQLRTRRVTLDAFGTLDAIPSLIGTFENIYLPMQNGNRFVEFDRLDALTDIGAKVDELKSFRDDIITGLSVPPLFLGVDEIEKKATASHQNILFARDIVDWQEMFTEQFNEFMYKLYAIAIPKKEDLELLQSMITIQFPPPKNLQIEMTSELVGSISSMVSSLKDLDIPSEYLVDKFLSNLIDLDKVKQYKTKEQMSSGTGETTTGGGGYGGI